jgi:hypothetical protein
MRALKEDVSYIITAVTIYVKAVIPTKAGIQNWTGCPRIRYGEGLSSPA